GHHHHDQQQRQQENGRGAEAHQTYPPHTPPAGHGHGLAEESDERFQREDGPEHDAHHGEDGSWGPGSSRTAAHQQDHRDQAGDEPRGGDQGRHTDEQQGRGPPAVLQGTSHHLERREEQGQREG